GAGPGEARTGDLSARLAFPFVALEQLSVTGPLDGLHIAVADATHAQGQPVPAELVPVGVEIDRDLAGASPPRPDGANKGHRLELGQVCGRKLELDLDFLWRGHHGFRTAWPVGRPTFTPFPRLRSKMNARPVASENLIRLTRP